jgi:starch synthase
LKILIASPEAVPYIKTGGLADVAGALSRQYREMGEEAFLIIPLYRAILDNYPSLKDTGIRIRVPVGNSLKEGTLFTDGKSAYFIKCDEFFNRDELYGTPNGDYNDNASRFIFFSRGVLEACRQLIFSPDIIHCHDWQTGLIPLYLRTLYKNSPLFLKTASIMTIHNLGYQGLFSSSEMPLTGLGWDFFTSEGIEFFGNMSFLKAGIVSADALTTVSKTYAQEILGREHGFQLEGVINSRVNVLHGIINGIDYHEWDPAKDSFLPENFSVQNLKGKTTCKQKLINTVSLDNTNRPLFGIVGRFCEQKGFDLVLSSADALVSLGVNLVILGKGDAAYQSGLSDASKRHKGRVSVTIGLHERLAHLIYAGSDFFLMPSHYEPCGLGQLISLRYGTIPVARKTGGLSDTIRDYNHLEAQGTGFLFSDYTPAALQDCVKRALCVYMDHSRMKKLLINSMKQDFSWNASADKYIKLYKSVLQIRKAQVIGRK